jgi:hypothetical protein
LLALSGSFVSPGSQCLGRIATDAAFVLYERAQS